ncbi:hypothetical protein NECAME_10196 [Necator americanus]|uniref:ShKT domain-containing protein n=1 Tax=Necator americanus TaxID=51031 RepID=W2T9M4_NECAM|nr:hypothetical protein NECAME_10196 [Necator americanus]ETN78730.1 hypothetical protein NECAME_10196 [Necator americanus]
MCYSSAWRNIIEEDCPNDCGFCNSATPCGSDPKTKTVVDRINLALIRVIVHSNTHSFLYWAAHLLSHCVKQSLQNLPQYCLFCSWV